MKIVAVDTSTAAGSVALLQDDQVVAEWYLQSAKTHNRRLLASLDHVLRQARWTLQDVDGFAVTTGPGSFTGLRIGLSTVKTLAWCLAKDFVGIPSLDALAGGLGFGHHPVCPVLDARKKEVYFGLYRPDGQGRQILQGVYLVDKPEHLVRHVTEKTIVCGDGWLLYKNQLLAKLGDLIIEAPPPCHMIRASQVGYLAMQKLSAGKGEDPVHSSPLYVRPSEAEIHRNALQKRIRRE
ncbi:tRNA (adenosine(37)-N6)-threonylcarbamoyltransferase complex dimerization subunit type 1 TsaB [Desulfoferrobacter suflitae]|uniref:tRNA (adenosine(37)-N6)-threonylcarbamoyltransferase complex dimerization subunit type 1 TsaB n=1 Tax=Desulfoferrobacter suflitae TaxID=2865782 RepID=UPI0021644623|nr:tRNA (adenosine(37)-N6)-threonylcarbamoyltransferase complex dimerization subunit type 1 TsaB [Desulfoferrobacter suflitae]MCK8600675.1 tRNA (adenosine(37)-N6)-threonylcarbamoyltransferase complex dimerization subunit type 1 TsaB [Desulfoferrobacter suflitae]